MRTPLLHGLLLTLAAASAAPALAQPAKTTGARSRGLSEAQVRLMEPTSADPFIAFLPAGVTPDYAYWRAKGQIESRSRSRARAARGLRLVPTATYQEQERGQFMRNDALDQAEPLTDFGPASTNPTVVIRGELTPLFTLNGARSAALFEDRTDAFVPFPIRLYASAVFQNALTVTGAQIGDGPYGQTTGDVDVYLVEVASPNAYVTIRVDTPASDLDPAIALYDEQNRLIAFNDDVNGRLGLFDSEIQIFLATPGTYALAVWGFTESDDLVPPGVADPLDPSTGFGIGSTGAYEVTVHAGQPDNDAYSVELKAGDVLAVASPSASVADLAIYDPAGTLRMLSQDDFSSYYPKQGRLFSPGDFPDPELGTTAALVAPIDGIYTAVVRGEGAYRLLIQASRPGPEQPGAPRTQRVFVDFDGHTVDTAEFKSEGIATLSPLAAFLERWELSADDESAVVDGVMRGLRRALVDDLRGSAYGMGGLDVTFLNSRDHPDPGAAPDVTRLVIGGTVDELDIETIGIASSVDVGNYRFDDVAVILLDLMSEEPRDPNSLNAYGLGPAATKVDLVAHSIAAIAAHEMSHCLGLHHTDNSNYVQSIIDEGGNMDNSTGVGLDRTFGTLDDRAVRLREDAYVSYSVMAGTQNSPSGLAHAIHTPPAVPARAGVRPGAGRGSVTVGAVRGGAPASQGFTYALDGLHLRVTGAPGDEALWVLDRGAEVWRRAVPGEVATLLARRDGAKPIAVTTEAGVTGSEARRALDLLRDVAGRD